MFNPSHRQERLKCLIIALWTLDWAASFIFWFFLFSPLFFRVAELFNTSPS